VVHPTETVIWNCKFALLCCLWKRTIIYHAVDTVYHPIDSSENISSIFPDLNAWKLLLQVENPIEALHSCHLRGSQQHHVECLKGGAQVCIITSHLSKAVAPIARAVDASKMEL